MWIELNVVKLSFVSVRESDGVLVERRHIGTTVPANLDVNDSPFAVSMSRCDGAGNANYFAKLETSHFSPLYGIGFQRHAPMHARFQKRSI